MAKARDGAMRIWNDRRAASSRRRQRGQREWQVERPVAREGGFDSPIAPRRMEEARCKRGTPGSETHSDRSNWREIVVNRNSNSGCESDGDGGNCGGGDGSCGDGGGDGGGGGVR